jgi:bidirectional [NiFe] hydrogenase diaphorase subunit
MTSDAGTERVAAVCEAASCLAVGSDRVLPALTEAVARAGVTAAVRRVGCLGLCAAGPLVRVDPPGVLIERVDAMRTEAVVAALRDPAPTPPPVPPFFARQVRVVTENCGRVDPENLDDYLGAGGYQSLRDAVTTMTPTEVVEQVRRSGLRGRGGAGYPTGLKWPTSPSPAATAST